jgi:hypothetical protein
MKSVFRMAALGLAVLVGSSFAVAQDWRHDRDNDDRYDNRYDNRYDRGYAFNNGLRFAHQTGFQDGAQVAREDSWRGKPFNPYPRGKYNRADHGYRREFGDRNAYRDRYADGYRDGYQSAFGGYRGDLGGYRR